MIRTLSRLAVAAALAWCGARVGAQTAPPDADLASTPSLFSTQHPPPPPPPPQPAAPAPVGGDQPISSQELNAAVAEGLPKYSPPKPAPAKPQKEVDLRDIDRPKNRIIRLPSYVVQAPKPPVFADHDLLTKQGQADQAMKTYVGFDPSLMPSLVASGVSRFLFQGYADQQAQDAQRQQNIDELSDSAAALARTGDSGESEYIKRQSDDTFMRTLETATAGSDPATGWAGASPGGPTNAGP